MIIMASVFFFGFAGATFVGLPVLAKGPLAAGPQGLGILFSASGLGALAGTLTAGAFGALIQQRAPHGYVGRVMGMLMFGIYGLYPVSYALAGWISELTGVRLLFVLGGAMIVLSGLTGLSVRELRAVD